MTKSIFKSLEQGNKGALLRKRMISYLILHGNSTILELSKTLDLSVPTVTKMIDEMCQQGILNEFGKMETNEGRHPHLYGLNPEAAYFVGVDIKNSGVNLGLINFNGDLLEDHINAPYHFDNSLEGLHALCRVINDFVDHCQVERDKIANVNVNVSGRVNPESGYSYSWFNLGEQPLTVTMSQLTGLHVTIDNDTRAMTYGEYLRGNNQAKRDILFVNVSWGLGLGIIIDGKVYTGKSGFAGEFGHTPVFDNEVICHCGKKGCLETEASGSAIHRKLQARIAAGENSILAEAMARDPQSVTLETIIDAVGREDMLCIELVEEVGSILGKQVAGLINLLNPELVIVGGLLSMTGDYLLQPLRTAMRKHSLQMVHRDTHVVLSTLMGKAGLVGACLLARSRTFADLP
ncbi:MAG: ROK family transcriptional regulator [Muribaculaceae bacterium]|nr:ROK family transcriptional regulator [Muribaculaceae bacterium]